MFVCFLFLDVCNYISEITEHYSALTVYRLSLKSYSPNASNEIVHTKHIKEILGGANCLIFLWCSISAFSGSALFWRCAWKLLDPLLFFLFLGGGFTTPNVCIITGMTLNFCSSCSSSTCYFLIFSCAFFLISPSTGIAISISTSSPCQPPLCLDG